MMFWRGWGLLVLVYLLLAWFVPPLLLKTVFGPGVSFLLAGLASILTGLYLNRGHGPVPYVRRRAEQGPFAPRYRLFYARHNFLFLPLEAWGILLSLLGLVYLIAGLGPRAD
jgi:hypothetical protein